MISLAERSSRMSVQIAPIHAAHRHSVAPRPAKLSAAGMISHPLQDLNLDSLPINAPESPDIPQLTPEVIAAFRIMDPNSQLTAALNAEIEARMEAKRPPHEAKPPKVRRYFTDLPGFVAVAFKDRDNPIIIYGRDAILGPPRISEAALQGFERHEINHLQYSELETSVGEEALVEMQTVRDLIARNLSPSALTEFLRCHIRNHGTASKFDRDPIDRFSGDVIPGITDPVRVAALETAQMYAEQFEDAVFEQATPLPDDDPLIVMAQQITFLSEVDLKLGSDYASLPVAQKLVRLANVLETLPVLNSWDARDLAVHITALSLNTRDSDQREAIDKLADAIIGHWTMETGNTCAELYRILAGKYDRDTPKTWNPLEAIRRYARYYDWNRLTNLIGEPDSAYITPLGRFRLLTEAAHALWKSRNPNEMRRLGGEISEHLNRLPDSSLTGLSSILSMLRLPIIRTHVFPGQRVPWQALVHTALEECKNHNYTLAYVLLRLGLDDARLFKALPDELAYDIVRTSAALGIVQLDNHLHPSTGHLRSPTAGLMTAHSRIGFITWGVGKNFWERITPHIEYASVSTLDISPNGLIRRQTRDCFQPATRLRYDRLDSDAAFAALSNIEEESISTMLNFRFDIFGLLGRFRESYGRTSLIGLSHFRECPEKFLLVNLFALQNNCAAQKALVDHLEQLRQNDPETTDKLLTHLLTDDVMRTILAQSCIPSVAEISQEDPVLFAQPWMCYIRRRIEECPSTQDRARFWLALTDCGINLLVERAPHFGLPEERKLRSDLERDFCLQAAALSIDELALLRYGVGRTPADWSTLVPQLERIQLEDGRAVFGMNHPEGAMILWLTERSALTRMIELATLHLVQKKHILDRKTALDILRATNSDIFPQVTLDEIRKIIPPHLISTDPLTLPDQAEGLLSAMKHRLYGDEAFDRWVIELCDALESCPDPEGSIRREAASLLLTRQITGNILLRQRLHHIWVAAIIDAPGTVTEKITLALHASEKMHYLEKVSVLLEVVENLPIQRGDTDRIRNSIGEGITSLLSVGTDWIPQLQILYSHLRDFPDMRRDILDFLAGPEDVEHLIAQQPEDSPLSLDYYHDAGHYKLKCLHRAYRAAPLEMKIIVARNFAAPPYLQDPEQHKALAQEAITHAISPKVEHFSVMRRFLEAYLEVVDEEQPHRWAFLVAALRVLGTELQQYSLTLGEVLGRLVAIYDDIGFRTIAQDIHTDRRVPFNIREGVKDSKHSLPPLNRLQRASLEERSIPKDIRQKIVYRGESCGRGRFAHAEQDQFEVAGDDIRTAVVLLIGPNAFQQAQTSFRLIEKTLQRLGPSFPGQSLLLEHLAAAQTRLNAETDFTLSVDNFRWMGILHQHTTASIDGEEIKVSAPEVYDVSSHCLVLEYGGGEHLVDLSAQAVAANPYLSKQILATVTKYLAFAFNGTIDRNPHGGNIKIDQDTAWCLDAQQVVIINPTAEDFSLLGGFLASALPDLERGIWPFHGITRSKSAFLRSVQSCLVALSDGAALLSSEDRIEMMKAAIAVAPVELRLSFERELSDAQRIFWCTPSSRIVLRGFEEKDWEKMWREKPLHTR